MKPLSAVPARRLSVQICLVSKSPNFNRPVKGSGVRSKMVINSTLLHDLVCCVPRFDFSIYGEIAIGNGAIPSVVIAFPVTGKTTSVLGQNISDSLFILSHMQ